MSKPHHYLLYFLLTTQTLTFLDLAKNCTLDKNIEKRSPITLKYPTIQTYKDWIIYKKNNSALKYFKQYRESFESDDIENKRNLLENEIEILKLFKNEIDVIFLKKCSYFENGMILKLHIETEIYKNFECLFNNNPIVDLLFWKYDIIFKLARGLKRIHDKNIIHGNININTIYFRNEYLPIFGDLENSIQNNIKKRKKLNLYGNILYLAPELITKLDYDKKSDIYALAGIFFFILNKKEPFSKNDIGKYRDFDYKEEKDMTYYTYFIDLLKNMTNEDVKKRFTIEQVLDS